MDCVSTTLTRIVLHKIALTQTLRQISHVHVVRHNILLGLFLRTNNPTPISLERYPGPNNVSPHVRGCSYTFSLHRILGRPPPASLPIYNYGNSRRDSRIHDIAITASRLQPNTVYGDLLHPRGRLDLSAYLPCMAKRERRRSL